MSSVNKVILVGNLGAEPEVRYTADGTAVCNLRLATNYKKGDVQRTEWHRVTVWGKQAELAGQFLTKGRQVYIEGYLQTRQWKNRDGEDRYTTEVQAQQVVFLGSKPQGEQPRGEQTPTDEDGLGLPPDMEA